MAKKYHLGSVNDRCLLISISMFLSASVFCASSLMYYMNYISLVSFLVKMFAILSMGFLLAWFILRKRYFYLVDFSIFCILFITLLVLLNVVFGNLYYKNVEGRMGVSRKFEGSVHHAIEVIKTDLVLNDSRADLDFIFPQSFSEDVNISVGWYKMQHVSEVLNDVIHQLHNDGYIFTLEEWGSSKCLGPFFGTKYIVRHEGQRAGRAVETGSVNREAGQPESAD